MDFTSKDKYEAMEEDNLQLSVFIGLHVVKAIDNTHPNLGSLFIISLYIISLYHLENNKLPNTQLSQDIVVFNLVFEPQVFTFSIPLFPYTSKNYNPELRIELPFVSFLVLQRHCQTSCLGPRHNSNSSRSAIGCLACSGP